jgi:hypothetical protein
MELLEHLPTCPRHPPGKAQHYLGKKSRTPSVKTRVVETKQKFSGNLENITFTLFTFCLLCFHFYSFAPALLFSLFFILFYTELIFLWCSAFFGQRVARKARQPESSMGCSSVDCGVALSRDIRIT